MDRFRYFVILLMLLLPIQSWSQNTLPTYDPNHIVIRLKPSQTNARIPSDYLTAADLANLPGVTQSEPLLYNQTSSGRTKESTYLSDIFFLTLEENTPPWKAARELRKFPNVLYAEPIPEVELMELPNDPAADPNTGQQAYLHSINAYKAWELFQGSSKIVIGSVDTGIQLNHEDLAGNIFTNENDPINGIDDDGNGYIDDYYGWDIADNNNNPTADRSSHGTQVAGVHSAVGNNAIGMAGVAYNSKILPVKIFRSNDNRSFSSYQGIIYAADMGVQVMNLSWGASNAFSQFHQDIINYAVLEKDVVVVAAAGNTNAELNFYPASYENVISAGASDLAGAKASYATYSYNIDLLAPGVGIYSTTNGNRYTSEPGSSFSAPMVAGAAALVRERFPHFTALQVGEQLKATAKNVSNVGQNANFEGKLGKGLLDVFAAISNTQAQSVVLKNINIQGLFGSNVFFDDTVKISGDLINFLNPVPSLQLNISTKSPFVTLLKNNLSVATMSTGKSIRLENAFELYVDANIPENEVVELKLQITGNNYSNTQYIVLTINDRYLDIEGGESSLSIAKNGNLGFIDDVMTGGNGYLWDQQLVSTNLGVMMGNAPNKLINNTINNVKTFTRDLDFDANGNLRFLRNSTADNYAESSFRDSTNMLSTIVEQKTIGWDDLDVIVLEYRLINPTEETIEDLKFGFYADFDLGNPNQNQTGYDASNKLGYTFDSDMDTYAGVAVISSHPALFSGIDLEQFNGNTADIDSVFSRENKFDYLNGTIQTHHAGSNGAGNNVAQIISAEVGDLPSNKPEKIAFVISTAPGFVQLQANINEAKKRYADFLKTPPLLASFNGCIDESIAISLPSGEVFEFYDSPDLENLLYTGNNFKTPPLEAPTSFFVVNIDGDYPDDVKRVDVLIDEPLVSFAMNADTLLLAKGKNERVQFTNLSTNAESYAWDFGNGLFSTRVSPEILYQASGVFTIKLKATSASGCTAEYQKNLVIIDRNPTPEPQEVHFCYGQKVDLTPVDFSAFKLYADEQQTNLIFEGTTFHTPPLYGDTTFFITNNDQNFESLPAKIQLIMQPLIPDFTVIHDTLDLTSNTALVVIDKSTGAETYHWEINETTISSEKNPRFIWDGHSPINIRQSIGNSEISCLASISVTIQPQNSPIPEITDATVCIESPAVIAPDNGEIFIFYGDIHRSVILGKGRSLTMPALTEGIMLYIAGVDSLIESELVSVNVNVRDFEDSIVYSPDFVILKDRNTATFQSLHDDAVRWEWIVEGIKMDTDRSLNVSFDSAGVYRVQLYSEDDLGCKSITSIHYEVFNVTSVEYENAPLVEVYPVPFRDVLRLNSDRIIEAVSLRDLSGKVLFSSEVNQFAAELSLHDIPEGIYTITVLLNDKTLVTKKIIKSKE